MIITPLLTPGELAALLRIPSARVMRLARRGRLPYVRLPGGEIAFDRQDIVDWIECHKVAVEGGADLCGT